MGEKLLIKLLVALEAPLFAAEIEKSPDKSGL